MHSLFDVNPGDDDDDFEATHRNLEAYAREGRATDAGRERLLWEQKLMRHIKKLEHRLSLVEDNQHATVEIAAIVQKEIGPTKRFVDAIILWRTRIISWAVAATITSLVAWFFGTRKPP
jgi:hypothetical protein